MQEIAMSSSNWSIFRWPFVRGTHRSPVNSPRKGQWRGALMFSLIRTWTNSWVNNGDAGDLRRHRAHCDVSVMVSKAFYHYMHYNPRFVRFVQVVEINKFLWITSCFYYYLLLRMSVNITRFTRVLMPNTPYKSEQLTAGCKAIFRK